MTLEELEMEINLLTRRTLAIEQSVPTLEEQWFSTVIPSWNESTTVSGTCRMTLMIAPVPCRILSADLSFEYTTLDAGQPVVPALEASYWRGVLERGEPGGSFPDMAARSTQPTGAEANGAILTRRSWSFDSADWHNDRDLNKGDLLCLNWQKVGDPVPLKLPLVATVRYAAL